MQLSPINLRGLLARVICEADSAPQGTPRPSERRRAIECWRCPECQEVHDYEDDAEQCCAASIAAEAQGGPTCPVCSETYTTHRDAADCCLWKDLDAPTRWRLADAVEAGSTWLEQLKVAPGVAAVNTSAAHWA